MPRIVKRILLSAVALTAVQCGDDNLPYYSGPGADAALDATGDAESDGAADAGSDSDDAPDASDGADSEGDVVDAIDASDAGDALDADDTPDASDAPDAPDGSDASDADAAPDTGDADASDGGEDVGPAFVRVGGVVNGTTFPVELALAVGGARVEVLIVDGGGPFAFEADVSRGSAFEVEVASHAFNHFCDVDAPASTAVDDVAVAVDCVFGRRLTASTLERDGESEFYAATRVDGFDGGFRTFTYESSGLGGDGVLFTSDDPGVEGGIEDTYFDGLQGGVTRLLHSGADATAWTDDDPIGVYGFFEALPSGLRTRSVAVRDAGPDGVWRTEDDIADSDSTYGAVVEGLQGGAYDCWAAWTFGTDRVADTRDDRLDDHKWRSAEYHAAFDAYPSEWLEMTGVGEDAIPCTDDDTHVPFEAPTRFVSRDGLRAYDLGPDGYTETTYNAVGAIERVTEFATSGSIAGPDADVIVAYTDYLTTENGDVREVTAEGPGVDGVWFTWDDDFRSADLARTLDPWTGEHLVSTQYLSGSALPGPDGIWGTRDDNAWLRSLRTRGSSAHCWVSANDPGDDGLWDESDCGNGAIDDRIFSVRWDQLDDMGRAVRTCTSVTPGEDGVWVTEDDQLSVSGGDCILREWIDERRSVWTWFDDPGDDGVPFTEDDTVRYIQLVEVDENGGEIVEAYVNGPGVDGAWFTGDDDVRWITRWTRDRFRQDRSWTRITEAGDDGLWWTDDDMVFEWNEYERVDRRYTIAR